MDPALRTFLSNYIGVVVSALLPVILTAFISVPWILGGHPGEAPDYTSVAYRHMS